MNQTRISMIMAVYNGQSFLPQCIRSIKTQTLRDFECIIVDDASTDGTAQLLAGLADERFRIFYNNCNLGLTRSLNLAARHAHSPLLARLDADDEALPQRLEIQIRHMETHPDCVAVGGQAQDIDSAGRKGKTSRLPTGTSAIRAMLAFINPMSHPTVTMRTEAFERVGGYNEDYLFSQDFDLWSRLAAIGELHNLPDVCILYRRRPTSITASRAREQRKYAAAVAHSNFMKGARTEVPTGVFERFWMTAFSPWPEFNAEDASELAGPFRNFFTDSNSRSFWPRRLEHAANELVFAKESSGIWLHELLRKAGCKTSYFKQAVYQAGSHAPKIIKPALIALRNGIYGAMSKNGE